MAGQISSFVSGGSVVVRIGKTRVAFLQDLRYSRSVDHITVNGLGSFSPHSLEPTNYGANWSARTLAYSTLSVSNKDSATVDRSVKSVTLPDALNGASFDNQRDGNSLIDGYALNPQLLLLSQTFDILVYERKASLGAGGLPNANEHGLEGTLIFTLEDCRIETMGISFVIGDILSENIAGRCRRIIDHSAI